MNEQTKLLTLFAPSSLINTERDIACADDNNK